MSVSLKRAGEILGLNLSNITEEEPMGNVSGVIKRKSVKGYEFGNQYSFMIGTDWYSVFDSKIKDGHTRELVEGLKEGDEVEMDFVDTPNKNKPGQVFHNITGVVRVERVGDAPPTKVDGKEVSNRSDAPDSMILSYAKDGAIALSTAGDNTDEFLVKVENIYRGMKRILAGE